MKQLSVVAGVVLVVAVIAIVLYYRSVAPRSFVATGRGAVADAPTITVTRVSVAPATRDYDGKEVQAGRGHKYVLLDCRIAAPANRVSFDDFQLVRDRAATVGDEANVGDNDDSDYFYWTYLDAAGHPVMEAPGVTGPFEARLAFKVPADASRGYLFYWGLYWGPFDFRWAP